MPGGRTVGAEAVGSRENAYSHLAFEGQFGEAILRNRVIGRLSGADSVGWWKNGSRS